MNDYKLLLFIAVCFLFISCGTLRLNRTKEFINIAGNTGTLNNEYIGYSEIGKENSYPLNILHFFNIQEKCNSFNLEFKDADKVSISYWAYNDSITLWKQQTFEGKWKKKYFEIYFEKKIFVIPFLLSRVSIDRVKIGKDKEGRLVVMHFTNQSGNLLFIGAGHVTEDPYLFEPSTHLNTLLPVYVNGRWGFQDVKRNIQIKPQYDYVHLFRSGAAVVMSGKKYGLINEQGKPLTALLYDKIEYLHTSRPNPVYNVTLNGKYGVIDSLGNVKLPAVYDTINNRWSDKFLIAKDGKFGFATNAGIFIPLIYDSSFWFNYAATPFSFNKSPMLAEVKRNGVVYFVDESAYEYDAKLQKELFNYKRYIPDLTSKRKISGE